MNKTAKNLFSLFLFVIVFIFSSSPVSAQDADSIPDIKAGNLPSSSQSIEGTPNLKSDQFQITGDNTDWFFTKKQSAQVGGSAWSRFVNAFKHFFQSIGYSIGCFFKGLVGKNNC